MELWRDEAVPSPLFLDIIDVSEDLLINMRSLTATAMLNSGFSIPLVGLGTYQMRGEECREAVRAALDLGYLHIDTAYIYRNEDVIGGVLKNYNRSKLFITSKIPPTHQGFEKALEAASHSMSQLGVDYLDLLLIHWPGCSGLPPGDPLNADRRLETWRALEQLQRQGKVRSIGVSNFLVKHLEPLLKQCSIRPAVNQFEYHPLCQDEDLVQFCAGHGIHVEAYSSLARGDRGLFESPIVQGIATRHGKTISQVLLRWGLQQGVVVLPKSVHRERIQSNAELDFTLNAEDMAQISGLNAQKHTCWDPVSVF